MKNNYLSYLLGAFLLCQVTAYAQPGSLDTSFGTQGKALNYTGTYHATARRALILPDGKTITAGTGNISLTYYDDLMLMKFNEDGSPDASFGTNGVVMVGETLVDEEIISMCLVDDKILISFVTYGTSNAVGYARFNADGSLDTMLNGTGFAYHEIADKRIIMYSLHVKEDGKIIAGGYTITDNQLEDMQWMVAQYNADMTVDTTFGGGDGYWNAVMNYGTNNLVALAVNNDGKIVMGGHAVDASFTDFTIMQLNGDGTQDTSFGTNGITYIDFNNFGDYLYSLRLQPDGKILLGGGTTTPTNTNNVFCAARLNTNGLLDETFGQGGKIQYPFNAQYNETATDVCIRSNGKIVLGGYMSFGDEPDFGLLFLNADGSPDTLFGNGGRVSTDFTSAEGNDFEQLHALCEQADGKIIAAGQTFEANKYKVALARYNIEEPTTDVRDINSDKRISVYPNPVNDVLHISFKLPFEKEAQIKLFTMNGQQIQTDASKVSAFTNTVTINSFAALAKGVYVLEVTAGNMIQTFKVVK